MILVERHIIKKSNSFYKECNDLTFKSKNLYNAANYIIRTHFFITKHYPNYFDIQKLFQASNPDYINLPAKVSQQVLKQLHINWTSFFAANKSYNKNPKKFKARPKPPKYKDSIKGRNIATYTNQAISTKDKGFIKLSQTGISISSHKKKIKQVRIVPGNNQFIIEIVYEQRRNKKIKVNPKNIAAIDLGLSNLATITSNVFNPVVINGKPLKSINQFYNKEKSNLQSQLPKDHFSSNRIKSLTNKRNNKVNNYLHNASKWVVRHCLTNKVGTLVIGHNPEWKNEINLGKVTNQNFVSIPFKKFIDQILYKCDLFGIKVKVREESYTSKCSLLDDEKICKHVKYLGKRVKRGLFKSSFGQLINADVNGSGNILRKAFPRVKSEGIEGLLVNPLRINPYQLAS